MEISPIAVIRTGFPEKFGVPRQSGLASALRGRIVFNKEFRDPSSLRGLEDFSHLWLIWEFSENRGKGSSLTVRPPRLGGNKRVGVFATRSPYRPNPIGLSSVRLEKIEVTESEGTVLIVSGADLLDGTPIYDIKPYLPYADSIPDAFGGFTESLAERKLEVSFPDDLLEKIAKEKRTALIAVLEADPRPSYQEDPDRIYGMSFADYEVKFKVEEKTLKVVDLTV